MYMCLHNAIDVGIHPRMPSECTIFVLFSKIYSEGGPHTPTYMYGRSLALPYPPTCAPLCQISEASTVDGMWGAKKLDKAFQVLTCEMKTTAGFSFLL